MSLENLLRIGQLKAHPPDAAEIAKLLAAAARNLQDARLEQVSAVTRFDVSYKAIMQVSLASLMASGYRPDTNRPGHHMTVIQSLPLTAGLDAPRVRVLDTLRRKRNLSDYTGADIDDSSAEACRDEAESLLQHVQAWLVKQHPELKHVP